MAGSLALSLVASTGCVSLTPQLHPTDVERLERIEDREEREAAYAENAIYRQDDVRGTRYVKGERLGARPRSWQSLDLVLRSDRHSSAALPEKKLRRARVLTGLVGASALILVGGFAASARDGLDLMRLNGTGAVLLAGGVMTLGFGIATGVTWGQARAGYEGAVDVYNDSLGMRLGIYDADGNYVPPDGVMVDEEGFIILDQREILVPEVQGPKPPPEPVVNPPLVFPEQQPEPSSEPAAQPEAAAKPDPEASESAADPAPEAPEPAPAPE